MKRTYLFPILFLDLILCVGLPAQKFQWEVGFSPAASNYMGDLVQPDLFTMEETNPAFALLLRRSLNENWNLRLNLASLELSGTDANFSDRTARGFSFENNLVEVSAMVEWDINGHNRYRDGIFRKVLSPYLFFGLGGVFGEADTDYSENSQQNPNLLDRINRDKKETSGSFLTIPIGFGLRYDLTERWNLGLEGGLRTPVSDYLDGVSESGNPDNADWYAMGGVTITCRFGSKEDTDSDGVTDQYDLCPKVAGVPAFRGCPDTDGDGISDLEDRCPQVAGETALLGCPDSDGDGVPDGEDECPDMAGIPTLGGCPDTDGDGVVDAQDECPQEKGIRSLGGCPDTDGDGVVDREDECPNEAGVIINRGCPDRDTDGDGVVDREDNCPQVAGLNKLAGCPDSDGDGLRDADDACPQTPGPVSNEGCPEIQQEELDVLERAIEAVRFETGGSDLKTSSYDILEQIAKILQKYPDYLLRIKGYTDNVGSEVANQTLSERRAQVCKDFIASRGIDTDRITAIGYGEANPVGDNNTPAGRRKNRRTEFEIFRK